MRCIKCIQPPNSLIHILNSSTVFWSEQKHLHKYQCLMFHLAYWFIKWDYVFILKSAFTPKMPPFHMIIDLSLPKAIPSSLCHFYGLPLLVTSFTFYGLPLLVTSFILVHIFLSNVSHSLCLTWLSYHIWFSSIYIFMVSLPPISFSHFHALLCFFFSNCAS